MGTRGGTPATPWNGRDLKITSVEDPMNISHLYADKLLDVKHNFDGATEFQLAYLATHYGLLTRTIYMNGEIKNIKTGDCYIVSDQNRVNSMSVGQVLHAASTDGYKKIQAFVTVAPKVEGYTVLQCFTIDESMTAIPLFRILEECANAMSNPGGAVAAMYSSMSPDKANEDAARRVAEAAKRVAEAERRVGEVEAERDEAHEGKWQSEREKDILVEENGKIREQLSRITKENAISTGALQNRFSAAERRAETAESQLRSMQGNGGVNEALITANAEVARLQSEATSIRGTLSTSKSDVIRLTRELSESERPPRKTRSASAYDKAHVELS